MTDKEINEAIAEACRWRCEDTPFERHGTILKGGLAWWHPEIAGARFLPPDYLNDLNAMHEAEKVLNEKQQVWYLQKLTQVRYKDGIGGMMACMIDKTTFATARQRAEAFLRTIGKWRDG